MEYIYSFKLDVTVFLSNVITQNSFLPTSPDLQLESWLRDKITNANLLTRCYKQSQKLYLYKATYL